MGAADADKHTDSNRNDDGSHVVHGTLEKVEQGLANHRQTLYIITVRQTKKEVRGDFPLDALFHYYFVLYTFKGFRDEERMLNTVILLELQRKITVNPIRQKKRTSGRVDGLLAVGVFAIR